MKSKKAVYPIVLNREKDGWIVVYIPDFDGYTQGKDLADALFMAQDAIEMAGVYLQDENKPIPAPSDIDSIETKTGEIKTLVTADFDAYRRKTETKVIKKTLSLPSWLNFEAEKAGINFSATLQEALKVKLGVEA